MTATTPASLPHWLLLHGTPLNPAVWTDVATHLPGTVWAPDVTPAAGTQRPQRQLADSVIAQASRTGGRWRVVGHSFGGQIALEIGSRSSHRGVDHCLQP